MKCLAAFCFGLFAVVASASDLRPGSIDDVDPRIGTKGTGHVFPGALMPFGMVQPGPDNADEGWSFSSGYQYDAPRILGFSNTHISGAGIPELGDVLLMPNGATAWTTSTTAFDSGYRKATEVARPGFYAVRVDERAALVELTATERVALQRYTFDRGGRVQVLVDLQHRLRFQPGPRVTAADYTMRPDGLHATVNSSNWVERQASVALRFDHPIADSQVLPARDGEKAPRLLLAFELGERRTLEVRVALSTVDEDGAAANLATADGLDFEAVQRNAQAAWNALLSRVAIDAPAEQRRIFYSALYRSLMHPSQIADVDGRVRGPKGEVIDAPGGVYYSTMSLWDTFRASHPLFTLVVPERVPGFVNTLLAHERQMGYLPLWTAWGRETHTMIGNPALPVISDAIAKGFPGIDAEAAFAAMLRTSTAERPGAPAWAQRSWALLDQYGYLPFDRAPGESVSKTAEYGYGDAAVAEVARHLGRLEEAERFQRRAASWTALFDPESKTLRGRDSTGAWRTPFDPTEATSPMNNPGDFTEANAWQYTATPALHDPDGFREQLGGRAALEAWLDTFFTLPMPNPNKHLGQEAMIGQYAHGNEPSHHIAWLYTWTDAPTKGERHVADIARRFYRATPDGIVGNDDAGQMSAWYVLATLGLYPSRPGHAEWTLGAPLVPQARIDGGRGGATFDIATATIDGPRIDGQAVPRTGVPDARLRHARQLELPNRNLAP
ncbi:GH92 family glycosyl hydrolase [Silanimonas sp.]|jgi:predicted alpha-1,2-mannosidase|uniref:GH92 family glycosyl hydrolase n=1 Tax=Silanimonas sp. TaxID=1929290 RepID=UPI0037C96A02